MADKPQRSEVSAQGAEAAGERVPEHISQNIDSIIEFYRREEEKITDSQRLLEHIGRFLGRPLYLSWLLGLIALWLLLNGLAKHLGLPQWDPPPFFWLQGFLGLGALLTATVVLIMQNRQAHVEARRLNLDLQVNLLTEQKTTKVIHLLEELRRDLPMVRDRHDAVAAALQKPTDPTQVLEALGGSEISNER